MAGLIVVFPNKDNATNIRNLLARGGMDVIGVCTPVRRPCIMQIL